MLQMDCNFIGRTEISFIGRGKAKGIRTSKDLVDVFIKKNGIKVLELR